jgi:hypothetical protein
MFQIKVYKKKKYGQEVITLFFRKEIKRDGGIDQRKKKGLLIFHKENILDMRSCS